MRPNLSTSVKSGSKNNQLRRATERVLFDSLESRRLMSVAPSISSVQISGQPGDYTLTIDGAGFGTSPVAAGYHGDTSDFRIADAAQLGAAEWGYSGDAKQLTYNSWSDGQVVVSGFGAQPGDAATLAIWNPQSGQAATWGGNVAPVSSATPQITNVSFSGTGQNTSITITGSGFGNSPFSGAFTGDVNDLILNDFRTHNSSGGSSLFEAGSSRFGIGSADGVTLDYQSWSNNQIVIGGLAGTYGQNGATLQAGDPVTLMVWNSAASGPGGPQTAWAGTVPAESGIPLNNGNTGGTIRITSGTGAFAGVSDSSNTITVAPSAAISGQVTLQADNLGPSGAVTPLIDTPSWGNPQTSWQTINSWIPTGQSTQTASISLTAPTTPGIYHLIFASEWEIGGDHVASATNWAAGNDVWGDGNDIATLSTAQIQEGQQLGYTEDNWLFTTGYAHQYVPLDAVTIDVQAAAAAPIPSPVIVTPPTQTTAPTQPITPTLPITPIQPTAPTPVVAPVTPTPPSTPTAPATPTPSAPTSPVTSPVTPPPQVVTPVPPSISAPATATVSENGTLTFGSGGNAITVADANANDTSDQLTIVAKNGIFALGSTAGVLIAPGATAGTTTVTGAPGALNASLAGLIFKPTAGFYGSASLAVTITDPGHSGAGTALSATKTVAISVTQVQQDIAVKLSGSLSDDGLTLDYSTGTGNLTGEISTNVIGEIFKTADEVNDAENDINEVTDEIPGWHLEAELTQPPQLSGSITGTLDFLPNGTLESASLDFGASVSVEGEVEGYWGIDAVHVGVGLDLGVSADVDAILNYSSSSGDWTASGSGDVKATLKGFGEATFFAAKAEIYAQGTLDAALLLDSSGVATANLTLSGSIGADASVGSAKVTYDVPLGSVSLGSYSFSVSQIAQDVQQDARSLLA